MFEINTHYEEGTIGYQKNRELREQLDYLHEEYNRIIEETIDNLGRKTIIFETLNEKGESICR